MKLISWNVNGLRACMTKGFPEYFSTIVVNNLSMETLGVSSV